MTFGFLWTGLNCPEIVSCIGQPRPRKSRGLLKLRKLNKLDRHVWSIALPSIKENVARNSFRVFGFNFTISLQFFDFPGVCIGNGEEENVRSGGYIPQMIRKHRPGLVT